MKGSRGASVWTIAALGLAAVFASDKSSAAEQDAIDFYKSRSQIILAYPSVESYPRLLGRYLSKYIPGNPTIVVQQVQAAGGLVLANQTYNTAPKDGTYLAMIRGSTLQDHVNGDPAAKFEGQKFVWIGNMNREHDSCVVWNTVDMRSIEDLYAKELIVGASGSGSQSYSFPLVYNAVLRTKFKIIPGYGVLAERLVAMERGELMGGCGFNTGNIMSTMAAPYRDGKIRILFQGGLTKDPDFADVPNILDQAKNTEDRQALEYMLGTLELGRPFAVPPETPADRVALLRTAFDRTIQDPDLLAEAKRMLLPIEHMNGADTAVSVGHLYATPRTVIARIEAILKANR